MSRSYSTEVKNDSVDGEQIYYRYRGTILLWGKVGRGDIITFVADYMQQLALLAKTTTVLISCSSLSGRPQLIVTTTRFLDTFRLQKATDVAGVTVFTLKHLKK